MKLSVIVPVYNTEDYLEKCIESIIQQDYKNIEIIIINDGSIDNSEKIIKKYKKKYPKLIKNIKQANKGQAYSRNVGLDLANGELITFVDSDDYIEPGMYKKMIDLMVHEKSDLVICGMFLEKEGIKKETNTTNFDSLYKCSASVCNKIMKRELINDLHFYEGIWYEDYNFFIKICLKKPKYSICKEPLYTYRIHNESTMNNDNSIKNLDIIKATNDIIENNIEKDVLDMLIIDHILIDAINRVHKQNSKDKKQVIKILNAYVKEHILSISNTKTFKSCALNKKIIMLLNYYNLGIISKWLLKIKKGVHNGFNNSTSI